MNKVLHNYNLAFTYKTAMLSDCLVYKDFPLSSQTISPREVHCVIFVSVSKFSPFRQIIYIQ